MKRILDNGTLLLLAQDDPDGRILALFPHLPVEGGQIVEIFRVPSYDYQVSRLDIPHPIIQRNKRSEFSVHCSRLGFLLSFIHSSHVPYRGKKMPK